jgi:hypothetical protein
LAQAVKGATSWQKFAKDTEEIIWVCFPEEVNCADLIPSDNNVNQVCGNVKEQNKHFSGKNLCVT